MFSTSDVGWAVGHSYNVYGPLIGGCTSLLYEGLPTNPDPGIWWALCEQYNVRTMFSSPTAIRVLKKHDADFIHRHDLRALKYLFLAGEPLDEPTAHWISEALGKPIIDNYWQTETGWPALTLLPGLEMKPVRFGSPGFPNLGYRMKVIDENTGEEVAPGQKGVLVVSPPLPPGCMSTVWNDDSRFLQSYFSHFKELLYSSLDWAIRDDDGYTFILGRTDDVINVAGHRLGTREIEEAISSHPRVAEAAVIGVKDELKGQVPLVFVTLKQGLDGEDPAPVVAEMMATVTTSLGAVARPAHVHVVNALPKTRSGKLLRRSLQALAEQRDPGDLSTLDDPGAGGDPPGAGPLTGRAGRWPAPPSIRGCRPAAGTTRGTCAKLGLSSTCNTRRAPGNARAVRGWHTGGVPARARRHCASREGMQWHCCTPRRLLAVRKSKTVAGACRRHCVRSC
jgi:propionyl-CoA synthetase